MRLARVIGGLAVLAVAACGQPAPTPAGGGPTDPAGPVGASEPVPPAAPLPAGLAAAGRAELTGRWVPAPEPGARRAPHQPHADLAADGSWTGSDGCNSTGGRWSAGPDGRFLAVAGEMTLMGCDGMVGVPSWLGEATRAGFDGPVLVLLAPDGRELGRLVRA